MDNKVTKKRLAVHFEYDWIKYVLVILLSCFVMSILFMQINIDRKFEKLEVFIACYDCADTELDSKFLSTIRAEGDDVIRKVNVNEQAPDGEYFATTYNTAGFTSDVMIIPESYMRGQANWFLEFDEYVIEKAIPEELRDSVEYYEYNTETINEISYNAKDEGKIFGVRVDNLKKLAVENPPFCFNIKTCTPDITDEQAAKYDSKFYMVFLPQSLKIGTKGEESKYHDLTQSYRFAHYFLTEYGL